MAYTLFDATLDLGRILMDVFESVATGGTTTTVVDTYNLKTAGWFSDGDGGSLWLKLTTKASKLITAHVTGEITFTPAQSATVQAGDKYAAAPGIYPRYALIQAINAALREIGKLPQEKKITAVANQEEYDNTDDVIFDEEIIGLELANKSTSPYYWTPHYRWHQTQGSPRTLIFDEGSIPVNAYPMRVYYLADHAEIYSDSDYVNSSIEPRRLMWEAAVHALRWRYQRSKQDDPSVAALFNESLERVGNLAREFLASKNQEADTVAKVGNLAADALAAARQTALMMANLYPIRRRYTPRLSRW